MNSKWEIYNMLPDGTYPVTQLIPKRDRKAFLNGKMPDIAFPIIAKPDIGLRGNSVKKVTNHQELCDYIRQVDADILLQELITLPNEIGLFYVKLPEEPKGRITGIVYKELMQIKGDGMKTVEELVRENIRYEFQLDALQKELGAGLQRVLEVGEVMQLLPYGNHARGAKFIDYSHKITPKMEETFDRILGSVDQFNFGRIDLMFNTWEELEVGKNFSIIELNGAVSEPTHVYDPQHSIFYAWKELAKHQHYMYTISKKNHEEGTPFLPLKDGISEFKAHYNHLKIIAAG